MADVVVQQPIRSVYKDGSIVVSNVKSKIDNSTTSYSVVNAWYDGSPMDDSKVDEWGIYSKYKETGEYLKENKPQWGETFLEVDTMAGLRGISAYFKFLIKIGYYKGVRLNGYYLKGDAPSIEYFLTDSLEEDDGGSIINLSGLKLYHDFKSIVPFKNYGIRGNGLDETVKIQKAINRAVGGKFIVHTPETNFLTGQILVPGYVNAEFEPNVKWKGADSLDQSDLAFEVLFRFINSKDIVWIANNAEFYLDKSKFTSEHNHIFMLDSCYNVEIVRAIAKNSGGDGFYIGGLNTSSLTAPKGSKTYSELIKLTQCLADNNKRNGCSLVGVKGFVATDCIFSGSNGTSIAAGFDIEPEARCEYSTDIHLLRCQFLNNAGKGFMTAFQKITEDKIMYRDIQITLTDCYSKGNSYGFCFQYNRNHLKGKISYKNCKAELNQYNGFLEYSSGFGVQKYYDNPVCINNNTSGDNSQQFGYGSHMFHKIRSDHDWITGNSLVNRPVLIDDRETKLIDKGIAFIRLSGAVSSPQDFTVVDPIVQGYNSIDVFVSAEASNVKLNYRHIPKSIATGTFNFQVTPQYDGREITNSGRTTDITCLLPVAQTGIEFTFRVEAAYRMSITPQSGSLIYGMQRVETSYAVFSSNVGDFITLRGRNDGHWDIVKVFGLWSNMVNSWSTVNRPQNPKIGRVGYNISLAIPEMWNNTEWMGLASSTSGSWIIGTGSIISAATASFTKSGKLVGLSGSINFTSASQESTITLPYAPDYGCTLVVGSITFKLNTGSTTATVMSSLTGVQTFQIGYKTA